MKAKQITRTIHVVNIIKKEKKLFDLRLTHITQISLYLYISTNKYYILLQIYIINYMYINFNNI